MKDFHEEIRADTIARSVLTIVHKQQLIDETRKMQIVPAKEGLALSLKQFQDVMVLAKKHTLRVLYDAAPMLSLERRKVINDLDQYARVVISQLETEKGLVLYCFKLIARELGINDVEMKKVFDVH